MMDAVLSKTWFRWLLVAIAAFVLEPWIEVGSALLFGFTLEHSVFDWIAPISVASLWVQIYGAQAIYYATMYLLPFVLIGGALLLGGLFVRKLVLDAVREARRD
jgi:hypothetical protein